MKKLIILLIITLCTACGPQWSESPKMYHITPLDNKDELCELEYEGHKYLVYHRMYGVGFLHSASCGCQREVPWTEWVVDTIYIEENQTTWKDTTIIVEPNHFR